MTVMKEGSPVRADNTPQNSPGVATYSKSWGHTHSIETEISKCMDVMLRDRCHPYVYTVENFNTYVQQVLGTHTQYRN